MKLKRILNGVVHYESFDDHYEMSDILFIKKGMFKKLNNIDQEKIINHLKDDPNFFCSKNTLGGNWVVGIKTTEQHLGLLRMLLITVLICSVILVPRLLDLWGTIGPGAIMIAPLIYVIIDSITEIYGYKHAKKTIFYAAISLLFGSLLIEIVLLQKSALPKDLDIQFENVLGNIPFLMSSTALTLLVATYTNVFLFHKIKRWTKGKSLWLRCGLSTLFGQFFGVVFWFLCINSINLLPNKTWESMMTNFSSKMIYAACLIPLTHLIVYILKQERTFNKESMSLSTS